MLNPSKRTHLTRGFPHFLMKDTPISVLWKIPRFLHHHCSTISAVISLKLPFAVMSDDSPSRKIHNLFLCPFIKGTCTRHISQIIVSFTNPTAHCIITSTAAPISSQSEQFSTFSYVDKTVLLLLQLWNFKDYCRASSESSIITQEHNTF